MRVPLLRRIEVRLTVLVESCSDANYPTKYRGRFRALISGQTRPTRRYLKSTNELILMGVWGWFPMLLERHHRESEGGETEAKSNAPEHVFTSFLLFLFHRGKNNLVIT